MIYLYNYLPPTFSTVLQDVAKLTREASMQIEYWDNNEDDEDAKDDDDEDMG